MAESAAPLVLVTGASGFIGTHLIKQLLTQGKYMVRGTIRSLKNEDKVEEIKGLVPDAKYPLELVEADLTKEEGWKKAVEGCTFVCHVASPFPLSSPRNEDDLIVPAVNGTLNVLKACAEVGCVKRVALTSSCVAVSMTDDSHPLSEADWCPEENQGAYSKSKIRAERVAWDFVEKLEDDKKFELAVINPGLVVGPFLTKTNSGSFDIIKSILTKGMPALAEVKMGIVHVHDVAAAHIAALEIPEAAGHRHITVERAMWFQEVAAVISQEFTPQGYSVTSMTLPKFIAWPMKFFSSDMKNLYPSIGKNLSFNTERLRDILKIEPLEAPKGIIESCYSLIEMGIVPKTPGYLGPPESRKQSDEAKEEQNEVEDKKEQPKSDSEEKPEEKPESKEEKQESTEEKQESTEEKPAESNEEKPAESNEEKPESNEEKPESQ